MANRKSDRLTEPVVRRMAGEDYYQRGLRYYLDGHVSSLEGHDDVIRAVVSGSEPYSVTLTPGDQRLHHSCDCPLGVEGEFCKHCVAVALAWLSRHPKALEDEMTLAKAGKILLAEDQGALVKMLLQWAQDDDRLEDRILLFAAGRLAPESAVAAVDRAFQKAVQIHGFIHYREASSWAHGVDDAIDGLAQLLQDGQAPAVVYLCESALQALAGAMESIDDSDGCLSDLRDRLHDLHFNACDAARPDPVALAKRLFQYELHSELDIFYGAAAQYASILGAKGLGAYRQLAEAEWRGVPARAPGDANSSTSYFKITHMMMSLARASGDVAELVAVMSRDLTHAYSYLKIGEVCRDAGQFDQALLWAEKGLQAFPKLTDARLREFAAHEYHRRGRHDDAMNLIWAVFAERPSLETYQQLAIHAGKAAAWPEWRERTLASIRQSIDDAKANPHRPHWLRADHGLLVQIYLHEADVDSAWREAQTGGCSDRLWLSLAEAREKHHPAAVAPIYFRLAEAALVAATNSRYDESVRLLAKAAAVMKRLGESGEAARQIEALRLKYKAKRNFGKLLDQRAKALGLR